MHLWFAASLHKVARVGVERRLFENRVALNESRLKVPTHIVVCVCVRVCVCVCATDDDKLH